ncbi:MAG: hypothetical protein OSB47_15790 [Pirellulaceae bacterium]|nr:hypothetical protein [Pirellulaceae bacterium]
MSKPVVWFVGRVDHEEFAPALQWLGDNTRLGVSATVDEALQVLGTGGSTPGAIVLGQSRRGEFSQHDQERMLCCAPLAEAVVLLGSWCEGETRSGSPAAGWHRVYWHQFVDRARVEILPGLTNSQAGESDARRLPRTVTENERGLARSRWKIPSGAGRIAINTPSQVDYEAVSQACQAAGYETIWCQESDSTEIASVRCVVWDRWGFESEDLVAWTEWQQQWNHLPTVATIGFPRKQDLQWVARGTVEAIVGKPFVLAELLNALEKAVSLPRDCEHAA